MVCIVVVIITVMSIVIVGLIAARHLHAPLLVASSFPKMGKSVGSDQKSVAYRQLASIANQKDRAIVALLYRRRRLLLLLMLMLLSGKA